MWHEGVAWRGGYEVNSCVYLYSMRLPTAVIHLIKYSDRCPGQNLNIFTVVADLLLIQNSPNIKTIDSKQLCSGHTHMEVDSAHAAIERRKKKYKKAVEVPEDWYSLVKSSSKKFTVQEMKPESFLNFADVLKHELVYRKKDVKNVSWKFESTQGLREKRFVKSFEVHQTV